MSEQKTVRMKSGRRKPRPPPLVVLPEMKVSESECSDGSESEEVFSEYESEESEEEKEEVKKPKLSFKTKKPKFEWIVTWYSDVDKNDIEKVKTFKTIDDAVERLKISKTSLYKYVKSGRDTKKSYVVEKKFI